MTNPYATGWWALRASNAQAQYGYGTRDEAQAWADHLNRDRTVDLYAVRDAYDDEVARLERDNGEEGVTLEDELREIAEAAE